MWSIVLPLPLPYESRGSWDWSGGERGHDSRYAGVPGEVGGYQGTKYLDRIRVSAEDSAESTKERYRVLSSSRTTFIFVPADGMTGPHLKELRRICT